MTFIRSLIHLDSELQLHQHFQHYNDFLKAVVSSNGQGTMLSFDGSKYLSASQYLLADAMQVYLPAIAGHIPPHMVRTISAFLDFCYLMRCLTLDNQMLDTINNALTQFHKNHVIFEECSVCPIGFSLPHQHSMVYYHCLIQAFGAPNGLCSSIAESKHIKAVKEPWHCSSHFEALRQMLVINQRIDKLLTIHVDYNM